MRSLHVVAALSLAALPLVAQSGGGSGKSIKDEDMDFTSRRSIPGSRRGLSQHLPPLLRRPEAPSSFEFPADKDAANKRRSRSRCGRDPTTNFPMAGADPATL